MVAVMTMRVGLSSGGCRSAEAADHRPGRQVHDGGEQDQTNDGAFTLAAAAGHHGEPFAPCQPDLVPGKPAQRRGRTHAATALGIDQRDEHVLEAGVVAAVLLAQLGQRAFGHQPAGGDDADPVRHPFGDFKNMCRHDHGAAGADAISEQPLDVTGGQRVEAGQRFVENDQPGVVDQCACQRDFLAHALGKAFTAFVQMRFQAERHQQLMRGGLRDRGIDAPEAGDEFEIFQRRQLVINHRLVRHPGHHLLGGDRIGQRIDPRYRDGTGVGPQQAGHHPQGGGLAGAIGAEQGVEFARANGQVERVDRGTVKTLR